MLCGKENKSMKIYGREIAQIILDNLKREIVELRGKGIIPHLAIILVGNDKASKVYVEQKEKKANEIGAKASIYTLHETTTQNEILEIITKLNNDHTIHGIIVQKPLPHGINSEIIDKATHRTKDIDAFHKDSSYPMPLPKAIIEILKIIFRKLETSSWTSIGVINDDKNDSNFYNFLKNKNIVVIGKGETGGRPIISTLKDIGIEPIVIDSKTINSNEITLNADIIICTVGKRNIINRSNIKQDVILIGVGMQKGEDEKLYGDYDEKEIEKIASYYTPIPGGVGPVNVAMLLKNLLLATKAII